MRFISLVTLAASVAVVSPTVANAQAGFRKGYCVVENVDYSPYYGPMNPHHMYKLFEETAIYQGQLFSLLRCFDSRAPAALSIDLLLTQPSLQTAYGTRCERTWDVWAKSPEGRPAVVERATLEPRFNPRPGYVKAYMSLCCDWAAGIASSLGGQAGLNAPDSGCGCWNLYSVAGRVCRGSDGNIYSADGPIVLPTQPATIIPAAPASQRGAVGPAACREVRTLQQAGSRDALGRITVEPSIIHVMSCGSTELYIYQYVNRPGYRVIRPPDWGQAIGGRDYSTVQEALAVASQAAAPGGGPINAGGMSGGAGRYGPFAVPWGSWYPTGIQLKSGQSFSVKAAGAFISVNQNTDVKTCGPDGCGYWRWFVLKAMVGTQMADVGSSGSFTADQDGMIELGSPRTNTFMPEDARSCTGTISVEVRVNKVR